MANPTSTTRLFPGISGVRTPKRLENGFRSVVAFANNPDLLLWEKGVTPPGIEGRDAIETSTMYNLDFHTKVPNSPLLEITEFTFKAAYDVQVYAEIILLVNCPDNITVWFPTRQRLYFHGFIKSFIPDELVLGQQPEATVTIVPSMWDANACVESAFLVYDPTGNCYVWGSCNDVLPWATS